MMSRSVTCGRQTDLHPTKHETLATSSLVGDLVAPAKATTTIIQSYVSKGFKNHHLQEIITVV